MKRGHLEGAKLVLEVEDSGGGVEESLERELFKGPVSSSKGKERGLGLWICGNIIYSAGGNIEYERGKEGAIFKVSLPAREEER